MSATRYGVVSLVAANALAPSACTRDGTPPPPPATSASPASAPPTERVVGPLRFIGDWLILLDVHAHVIADFIEDALPK